MSEIESPVFDLVIVQTRLMEKVYALLSGLPLFALAALVVWVGWRVGRWLAQRQVIDRISARNPFVRDLARTTLRWTSTAVAIVVALEILDATALVGAMLGTAGVLGIALGFAFKDTLENYLAGILMSLRQPFAPRDAVVIGGNEGTVIALTSRATILMTPDGNHLRLPNALVFRSVILNYTRNPSRRFEFDVGVGTREDLVRAQVLGIERLSTLPGVLVEPPPRAFVQALGDSNVQLRFRAWVDQREHDFWVVRGEAIRTVKLALDDAGMDMPEPIYRVQLNSALSAQIADTDPMVTSAQTTKSGKTTADRGAAPIVDVSVNEELHAQIERDCRSRDVPDLLNADAPRE